MNGACAKAESKYWTDYRVPFISVNLLVIYLVLNLEVPDEKSSGLFTLALARFFLDPPPQQSLQKEH